MSNNISFRRQQAQATAINNEKPQFTPSVLWVNVGYEYCDEITGEIVFVSLPMGIPLDSTKEVPTNSTNESYRKLQQAKNAILYALKEKGETLNGGEGIIVPKLQVQLRKVNDATQEENMDENPMIMMDLF